MGGPANDPRIFLVDGSFSGSSCRPRVVVTATAGFRHDSIETAERVIAEIGSKTRWFDVAFARDESEMVDALSPDALRGVKLVMFVNTTGDLQLPRREALLQWIANGGSFIGAHSASDTWHEWPEYIDMLGGEFRPSSGRDYAHAFRREREQSVDVDGPAAARSIRRVLSVQELRPESGHGASFAARQPENGELGFFPMAWTRTYGNGRVFYTALGHRIDVWRSEWFQRHLTGAIAWGLRRDELPRRRAAGKQ